LEIDLVLEQGARLTTAEVKATTSPRSQDAQSQQRFVELAGERVVGRTVFHLGAENTSIQGCRYAPWHAVDSVVEAWGQ
jgi:hypothetical protein